MRERLGRARGKIHRATVGGQGRVRLAGLTIEEAEAELFQSLVENQIDPAFSLEIAEFNSQHVNVGGAVTTAASVPVTLNTYVGSAQPGW